MRTISTLIAVFVVAALGAASLTAHAETYPSRSVRLITGGAGTFHDIVTRQLAQQLSQRWGQPVVVDNQPAAALTVGTAAAARAAPDGYTLVMSDRSALAVAPSLLKVMPYDVAKDFVPVTLAAQATSLLVTHPSVPATTLAELLALLRRETAEVHFASAGPGTNNHIAMELLKAATGLNLAPIHYKGGGASTTALLGGEVKFGFALLPTVLPHVKAGKLKAFVVTGKQRFPGASEIATAAESGLPGFELEFWIGVLAPKNTPAEIVAKLNRDIGEVLRQPEMQALLQAQGAVPAPGSPEAFAAHIASEATRMRELVQRTGMRAD